MSVRCRFAVNIGPSDDRIALHLNPRFNAKGDTNIIVCNTFEADKWCQEQREKRFPFSLGKDFKVSIYLSIYTSYNISPLSLMPFRLSSDSLLQSLRWLYQVAQHLVSPTASVHRNTRSWAFMRVLAFKALRSSKSLSSLELLDWNFCFLFHFV